MWRRKLKTRLLRFVAQKLRTWAGSIERNVPQQQEVDQSATSDEWGPGSGGPPQHWLDLVREKAPELLSLPRTNPASSQPVRQVSTSKPKVISRQDPKDVRETETPAESRPKPILLKYAKLPSTLRNRTIAKARAFTRSKFLTIRTSRKPAVAEGLSPEAEEIRRLDHAEDQSAIVAHESFQTRKRPTNREEPAISLTRRAPHGSTVEPRSGSSRVASKEESSFFVERAKRDARKDRGAAFEHAQSKASRTAADETVPITRNSAKREVESPPPTIVKGSRPPYGPTLEPLAGSSSTGTVAPKFVIEPAREKSEYAPSTAQSPTAVHEEHQRISPAPVPVATQRPALVPITPEARTSERSERNAATIIDYSLARPIRQSSQENFEKAQANIPALLDEDDLSGAAAVQWTKIIAGENPWPDLPSPSSLQPEDELAAHTRELDRYRRLELEQRGTLWNE